MTDTLILLEKKDKKGKGCVYLVFTVHGGNNNQLVQISAHSKTHLYDNFLYPSYHWSNDPQ